MFCSGPCPLGRRPRPLPLLLFTPEFCSTIEKGSRASFLSVPIPLSPAGWEGSRSSPESLCPLAFDPFCQGWALAFSRLFSAFAMPNLHCHSQVVLRNSLTISPGPPIATVCCIRPSTHPPLPVLSRLPQLFNTWLILGDIKGFFLTYGPLSSTYLFHKLRRRLVVPEASCAFYILYMAIPPLSPPRQTAQRSRLHLLTYLQPLIFFDSTVPTTSQIPPLAGLPPLVCCLCTLSYGHIFFVSRV